MTEAVAILGSLMGLPFVSGLRLYSSVLAIGLGIRLGYLVVPEDLNQLDTLAQPSVLTVAGILYTLEFFGEKILWIDTSWDAVHTCIRPIGAAILAATECYHREAVNRQEPVDDV
jgi:hypothetical protein